MLDAYFNYNSINLEARWGCKENGKFIDESPSEISIRTKRIMRMIKKDFPAIISVGPYKLGDVKGARKYDIHVISSSKGNGISFQKVNGVIKNHYFTVTGVIEDRIKLENGYFDSIMFEVSSWGQKYYVSNQEIQIFAHWNLPIFTNVLYLEEKL